MFRSKPIHMVHEHGPRITLSNLPRAKLQDKPAVRKQLTTRSKSGVGENNHNSGAHKIRTLQKLWGKVFSHALRAIPFSEAQANYKSNVSQFFHKVMEKNVRR